MLITHMGAIYHSKTGNLGIRRHVQVYDIQTSKEQVLHLKGKPNT